MNNINNIRIAMMELFYKNKKKLIPDDVAEYFITKLDDINHNQEMIKILGDDITQNLYDVVRLNFSDMYLSFKGLNNLIVLEDDDKAKKIRDTFFMKQKDGSFIFLGNLIDIDEYATKKLFSFLKHSTYSPHVFEYDFDIMDLKKFNQLSGESLLDYKNYIDEYLKCMVAVITKNHPKLENARFQIELENWKKYMSLNKFGYRLDAYNKASELANVNETVEEDEKE